MWLNPRIDKVTSANDFSFDDIRRAPHSIYIVANSDDIPTLAPLLRLLFGELIATMRARVPDPRLEPWPVQIILDEFDQLGHMPIIVQSLKQLAGHGARVSIITQSVPGLESIYTENERLSIESAAGMKLYIAPNEKKTTGEVSEALGKTTRLSLSDSYSQDAQGILKRSISRRNEERPLLTPGEVRNLDPNKIILIPERQNPILVDRIVYWEDPFFKAIFEAQKGPLPYPDPMRVELDELRAEIISLREAKVAYPPADPAAKRKKGKAKMQEQEPPLAREVAEDWNEENVGKAAEAEGSNPTPPTPDVAQADTAMPTAEDSTPKKQTLAREIAKETHGESDDEVRDAIKPDTQAAKAKMTAFDERLKAKRKAA